MSQFLSHIIVPQADMRLIERRLQPFGQRRRGEGNHLKAATDQPSCKGEGGRRTRPAVDLTLMASKNPCIVESLGMTRDLSNASLFSGRKGSHVSIARMSSLQGVKLRQTQTYDWVASRYARWRESLRYLTVKRSCVNTAFECDANESIQRLTHPAFETTWYASHRITVPRETLLLDHAARFSPHVNVLVQPFEQPLCPIDKPLGYVTGVATE